MREAQISTLKLFYRGKARDIYEIDKDKLLIVATDRISCFDYVLPTEIPDKGKILNMMSLFWFNYAGDIIENHIVISEWEKIKRYLAGEKNAGDYRDRCVVVQKAKRINIECIVRGYLSGSAWKEYKESGIVSGIRLKENMKESEKLDEPIFTPSVKSMSGHDINITEEQMIINETKETTGYLKEKSLSLYRKASAYAYRKGIILADTKFEFGTIGSKIILIDEIFTPDSSRFWDKDKYSPGRGQDSFDKQFVRDYLEKIGWNKQPPVPALPEDIVSKTREKYLEAYKRITG